jgi:Cytidylate kinase-like family/BON domain
VLIRGWGATFLLRHIPHVICVRICAPMSFREQVLMKRLGIENEAVARAEIEANDAAHNRTMQRLFGINWTDPSLYAIVLNTACVPVPDCVEHIVRMAESPSFQETPQSRSALADELILSRVRATLEQRFGSSIAGVGSIDATVAAGKVTLMGASSDERLIAEIVRLMHGVDGVIGVESKIIHLSFRPVDA